MRRMRIGASQVIPPSGEVGAIPDFNQLDAFNVNREGKEAIGNGLYDSAAYAAAGQTVLTFFQNPIGQGTGVAGGTKTIVDTNMRTPGALPAFVHFLCESIEVLFEPTVPSVAANNIAAFGAQAVAASINDSNLFYRGGALIMRVGAKEYVEEAPLMNFPAMRNLDVQAAFADTSTVAANLQTRVAFATARGRPYFLRSPLRIPPNQNFEVRLVWDAAVAITNAARVFVRLGGILYRQSQ